MIGDTQQMQKSATAVVVYLDQTPWRWFVSGAVVLPQERHCLHSLQNWFLGACFRGPPHLFIFFMPALFRHLVMRRYLLQGAISPRKWFHESSVQSHALSSELAITMFV